MFPQWDGTLVYIQQVGRVDGTAVGEEMIHMPVRLAYVKECHLTLHGRTWAKTQHTT